MKKILIILTLCQLTYAPNQEIHNSQPTIESFSKAAAQILQMQFTIQSKEAGLFTISLQQIDKCEVSCVTHYGLLKYGILSSAPCYIELKSLEVIKNYVQENAEQMKNLMQSESSQKQEQFQKWESWINQTQQLNQLKQIDQPIKFKNVFFDHQKGELILILDNNMKLFVQHRKRIFRYSFGMSTQLKIEMLNRMLEERDLQNRNTTNLLNHIKHTYIEEELEEFNLAV